MGEKKNKKGFKKEKPGRGEKTQNIILRNYSVKCSGAALKSEHMKNTDLSFHYTNIGSQPIKKTLSTPTDHGVVIWGCTVFPTLNRNIFYSSPCCWLNSYFFLTVTSSNVWVFNSEVHSHL
uniref:Uncharacterized protein n=1 Tax=Micrurus corallinus TaxID=54390 RepID=A0A2D4EMA5_MICCO